MAATIVLGSTLLCVATLLLAQGHADNAVRLFDPYILRALRFTLWQASLSTLLSVAAAVPIARAFARREKMPGRELVLKLFALPLGLPQLVVVLGILSVWGGRGWINDVLDAAGLAPMPPVFGLAGILLAHVFFNLPLAVRYILASLDGVPKENWRLAASLSFTSRDIFRLIEWPHIRASLPGIAALIFMLCVTSFTVVLTLGGGPQASTLEVSIYQALRFDFDPALAARLAFLQITLCALLLTGLNRLATPVPVAARLRLEAQRPDAGERRGRLIDGALIVSATAFVALPVVAIAVDGLTADFVRLSRDRVLWRALFASLGISAASALLAIVLTFTLAQASLRSARPWSAVFRFTGSLVLLVPPLVIAAGAFLLSHRFFDAASAAPFVVVAVNGIMALPFAFPVLATAMRRSFLAHDRVAASLGLEGFDRLRLVEWPVLRPAFLLAGLIAALVSLGDFGVVAFFGGENFITLPLYLYQRLGSYRTSDAAGIALVLLLLCFVMALLVDRLVARAGEQRA
ncbi:MAG: thiamine/thiamine pyrophosphate ABC transporter permease [Pseudomonadota bacterium]|nr:thiamine/thiamine pyrophosphate ABC transporter permease [Pseudomonadota bacterium]